MKYLGFLGVVGLVMTLGGCSVFGIQDEATAPYRVVERAEAAEHIEIRHYPPLLIARTVVSGDYDALRKTGFRRLFDYISGANGGQRNIAMTAPVLQQEGTPIAMTAPVLMAGEAQNWMMAFVLPKEYTLATAPTPTNPEVEVIELPARKMAVITFSGLLSQENIAEHKLLLQQWLAQRQLKAVGAAMTAGYNPPWTIPLWRRNEVLLAIE